MRNIDYARLSDYKTAKLLEYEITSTTQKIIALY